MIIAKFQILYHMLDVAKKVWQFQKTKINVEVELYLQF